MIAEDVAWDDEDEGPELIDFATRVEESVLDEATNTWRVEQKLVVVPATSPSDAQLASGLIDSTFREATEAELEEWDAITAADLNDKDVEALLYLVRRAAREIAKRRIKDREKGRRAHARDAVRFKARKYAELVGKLEVYDTKGEDDGD